MPPWYMSIYHVTFYLISITFLLVSGRYDNEAWRSVVFHFHQDKNNELKIDLFVNCHHVGNHTVQNLEFKSLRSNDNLELRLVQREIAGKIFSRYKVGS